MKIAKTCGYGCLGILSCGPSQALAVVGLVTTLIKNIYDIAMRALNLRRMNLHASDKDNKAFLSYKNKYTYYTQRLEDNHAYTKFFATCLLPIVGLPLAFKQGLIGNSSAASVRESMASTESGARMAKKSVYPRSTITQQPASNQFFIDLPKASKEIIKTPDGRSLEAAWLPGNVPASKKENTVLMFHGNGMTLHDMVPWAEFFHFQGLNVLAITMGGYPGSVSGVETTELSTYHDAQAALTFAKNKTGIQDNSKYIAYGLSVGGSLAFQLGAANPGVHVMSDQTFDEISNVPGNFLPTGIASIGQGVVSAGCQKGISDGIYTTDGLNNKRKAGILQGSYFGIYSQNDFLMKKKDGGNTTLDLVDAYSASHPLKKKDDLFVQIPGGHCAYFGNHDHAVEKVKNHLKAIGFC